MTIAELRDWLAAYGWIIAPNPLASTGVRWYAWRSLTLPARDCDHNDKPPCLLLHPASG